MKTNTFLLPDFKTPKTEPKPVFKPDLTIDPKKWEREGFSATTIKMVSRVGLVKNFLL